jgi:hypothetical protein
MELKETRLPERLDISALIPVITPDNVVMFAVFVAMFPVAVARLEFVVAIEPVIAATVPERAFCALRLVK